MNGKTEGRAMVEWENDERLEAVGVHVREDSGDENGDVKGENVRSRWSSSLFSVASRVSSASWGARMRSDKRTVVALKT